MTTNMNKPIELINQPTAAETPKASDTTLAAFIWKNAEDLWGDFNKRNKNVG